MSDLTNPELLTAKEGHLLKAAHNVDYLNEFDPRRTRYLDWAITAVFYAALHYIDAYLATCGYVKLNHLTRNQLVRELEPLAPIKGRYKRLYDTSIKARYGIYTRIHTLEVEDYKDRTLPEIKDYVLSLLKKSSRLTP